MVRYPYRLFIVLLDAHKAEGNQIAVELFNGDENQRNAYSIPLSASGEEPVTHWLCTTPSSQEMNEEMMEKAWRVPSVQFFTCDAQGGFLLATSVESLKAESLQQGAYTVVSLEWVVERLGLEAVPLPEPEPEPEVENLPPTEPEPEPEEEEG
jgi:hypothetical protein